MSDHDRSQFSCESEICGGVACSCWRQRAYQRLTPCEGKPPFGPTESDGSFPPYRI